MSKMLQFLQVYFMYWAAAASDNVPGKNDYRFFNPRVNCKDANETRGGRIFPFPMSHRRSISHFMISRAGLILQNH